MKTRSRLTSVIAIGVILAQIGWVEHSVAADGKYSIGLVLTHWVPAVYETPGGKEECPNGFHQINEEFWLAQFPTAEQRAEETQKYIHLGHIDSGGPLPRKFLLNRGPDGANVLFNPTLVKDAPLREVKSKIAYGINLDNTSDGHATPNSCKHEKFVTPSGEQNIDNQLYRVIGCAPSWRKGGMMSVYTDTRIRTKVLNRTLIEITGVGDEYNNNDVEVAIYKGVDDIAINAAGEPIPWMSQRVDVRLPKFISRTHGRIVNGVLYTDPVDHYFPRFVIRSRENFMRGMRLQLTLNKTGADGMIAGYENLKEWWRTYQDYGAVVDSVGFWDPPAVYEAVTRLADGYPDPGTGQCTAISSAYQVSAVRAYIVHPSGNDPLVVDGNFMEAKHLVATSENSKHRDTVKSAMAISNETTTQR
jgi:hypothetical protein